MVASTTTTTAIGSTRTVARRVRATPRTERETPERRLVAANMLVLLLQVCEEVTVVVVALCLSDQRAVVV